MRQTELLQHIRGILGSAGFYVSDIYPTGVMGFDLITRKDESLLIIKALTNIDSLSEDVAEELKKLSFLLKATPILIGEKNGTSILEDGVAYFRFGIQAITPNTLKDHTLEGESVKAYAAPGGLYVSLDENEIRRIRLEQNISLGEFARFVRVSRRTAQMYEEGMNARIEIASRIEQLLGSSTIRAIDILKIHQLEKVRTKTYQPSRAPLQQEVFLSLERVGYKIVPMDRCPFEAVSTEKENVLLTCVQTYNKSLRKKAHIVSRISKITEKHAALFTDKDLGKNNIEGTPIIRKRELKKIRDPKEIIELILERK